MSTTDEDAKHELISTVDDDEKYEMMGAAELAQAVEAEKRALFLIIIQNQAGSVARLPSANHAKLTMPEIVPTKLHLLLVPSPQCCTPSIRCLL